MSFIVRKFGFLSHPRTLMLAILAVAVTAGFTFANWSPVHALETSEVTPTVEPAPEASAKKTPLRISYDNSTYQRAPHSKLTLSEGDSVTFHLKWTKSLSQNRVVFVKLSPRDWKGGKNAVAKRGITYSNTGDNAHDGKQHTFTPDNWQDPVTFTITFPETTAADRDLEMKLVHAIGANDKGKNQKNTQHNWKGTLFELLVDDNDN